MGSPLLVVPHTLRSNRLARSLGRVEQRGNEAPDRTRRPAGAGTEQGAPAIREQLDDRHEVGVERARRDEHDLLHQRDRVLAAGRAHAQRDDRLLLARVALPRAGGRLALGDLAEVHRDPAACQRVCAVVEAASLRLVVELETTGCPAQRRPVESLQLVLTPGKRSNTARPKKSLRRGGRPRICAMTWIATSFR